MAQIASALFFMILFIGCGTALQRMLVASGREIIVALLGRGSAPVVREFRVTVRPCPALFGAAARAAA